MLLLPLLAVAIQTLDQALCAYVLGSPGLLPLLLLQSLEVHVSHGLQVAALGVLDLGCLGPDVLVEPLCQHLLVVGAQDNGGLEVQEVVGEGDLALVGSDVARPGNLGTESITSYMTQALKNTLWMPS